MKIAEYRKELSREEEGQVLSNEGADILMGEQSRPPPIKQDRSGGQWCSRIVVRHIEMALYILEHLEDLEFFSFPQNMLAIETFEAKQINKDVL